MPDEKLLTEFVYFSVKETINNLKKNKNADPSFKVIEDIVKKYGISKKRACSAYRPVFWYLSDQEIINTDGSDWSLKQEYQNSSRGILNKLTREILHSYRNDLTRNFV